MEPIRLVCATRGSQQEFLKQTALGKWAERFASFDQKFEVTLFDNNRQSLSALYNSAIRHAKDHPALLVFLHDDLHIMDLFWQQNLRAGLAECDILGVAGTTRRVPGQPSWAFLDPAYTWDKGYLSGIVAHGNVFPPASINFFGEVPKPCVLLDGVLLAAHSRTLLQHDLFFDEQFKFHFYDMDFCRQAEIRGLRMSTWPISILHESAGGFGDHSWNEAYRLYLAKYGEDMPKPQAPDAGG
jgi:GT2 family glycosyltransferase